MRKVDAGVTPGLGDCHPLAAHGPAGRGRMGGRSTSSVDEAPKMEKLLTDLLPVPRLLDSVFSAGGPALVPAGLVTVAYTVCGAAIVGACAWLAWRAVARTAAPPSVRTVE